MSKVTDEHIERLKMHFITTDVSLSQLARISKSICGISVSAEMIRSYSSLGTSWQTLRDQFKSSQGSQQDTGQQIFQLKDVIFNQIMASSRSGLLVYGVNVDAVRELIDKEFPSAQTEKISPTGIDSALVNAYMTLIQKGNISVQGGASGKISQQQAIEMIREQLESRP